MNIEEKNKTGTTKSWADPSRFLQRVYVEKSVLHNEYTQEILERTGLPFSVVEDRAKPNDLDRDFAANLTAGKQQLFLCENRGIFFKPCPGTREYRCCEYQVLNTGSNCPIDCAYCILQAYLNNPWLTCYMNIERMFAEMREAFQAHPDSYYRVGTGEFTDSLAIDRITALSRKLVPFFAGYDNAILELKTKSAMIDNLLDLDHNGRTVVAWSLNSPFIMKTQEFRSATVYERLNAARICAEKGYKIAFHFDPIVEHDGWEDGYRETIELLFSYVPPEKIVWISLGALRYLPSLKEIGTQRFPASRIYYNEFVPGLDGKQRYFRPNRVRLYKHIYTLLKQKAAPDTCIYFCMESDEIWREVMGFAPEERGGIPRMLDRAATAW